MSPTAPRAASHEATPALVLRTGRADGSQAHFRPDQYQLVLRRDDLEEKVDLGYSGSRLLERLLQNPGEVVPRDELLTYAWTDRIVGQGSLNQQIYTLRQILADEKKREIIQTLPRRGYMFNPDYLQGTVSADESASATGLPDDEPPLLHISLRTSPRRRLALKFAALACALVCLALIVAATIYYSLLRTQVLIVEKELGPLHLTYSSATQANLQQLMSDTSALTQRFAELAESPMRLRLNKTADLYEVLCIRPGADPRWLVIYRTQLAGLNDDHLRSCLQ